MAKAYIMIGIQGSGKSTLAKKLRARENAVIICPDEYRCEYTWPMRKIFEQCFFDMRTMLRRGHHVILDATSVKRCDRMRATRFMHGFTDDIIGVWVDVPLERCLEHHGSRPLLPSQETLRPDMIQAYAERLVAEPPCLTDGFTQLVKIPFGHSDPLSLIP